MRAPGAGPAVALRVTALAVMAGIALVQATSTSPVPRRTPAGTIGLVVLDVRGGVPSPIADVLSPNTEEVRFSGVVSKRCHLFVFAADRSGLARRMGPGAEDEPGHLVGPGEFRVPGGFGFDPARGPIRVWAVCGSADLRYSRLAEAARAEVASHGHGAEGLSRAMHLEGLPEDVVQTSRLVRFAF